MIATLLTSSSLSSPAVDAARPYDGRRERRRRPQHDVRHGTALLPSDLTDEQLAAAPVLTSIDALLIDDLSEDEDEAFAAALDS